MTALHGGIVLGLGTLLAGNGQAWGLVWAAAVLWSGRQAWRRLRYLGSSNPGLRAAVLAFGLTALLGL